MIRWIYNVCFPLFLVLLLPGYLRRMVRRGNYRRDFWQRFGFFRPEVRERLANGPGRMWLQAVSVGEMLVALKLVAALRARNPALPLVLSTTTTTGYQLARERAPDDVEVVYTPIDLLGAVRRTFRTLRPVQLVIVDGGLWPNQLWEARRLGVPTALVNARLSPRSERRFHKFRRVTAAMFGLLDLVAVPGESDLARWRSLGVPTERLRHTGSIKFDDAGITAQGSSARGLDELRRLLTEAGWPAGGPVVLAGSTHPGEEKIIGEIYRRLRPDFAHLFLVVAPRHVERSAAVRADLEALGLRVVNRTTLSDGGQKGDVLVLDTTGELRDWYAAADLVFIGKSLAAIGGQNPAEAVAAGKPVIFGSHMENFEDLVAALLAVDGAVQVRAADELTAACRRLLEDPKRARALATRARQQLDAHQGAAARTADLLLARTNISTC